METLLIIHITLSFIALTLGVVATLAFFASTPRVWTELFLLTAIATTLTGFLFPNSTITPAVATGMVASLVFLIMLTARFIFKRAGAWNWIYAAGIVISTYFLAFVTVAQAFLKIPELHALAPTQSEPAFALAQLAVLAIFIWIGIKTIRKTKLQHS